MTEELESDPAGVEFNLEDFANRTELIATHVGRYMLNAAAMDQKLTEIVAMVSGSGGPTWLKVIPLVKGRFTADKVKMLRAVWPAHWFPITALANGIDKVNEYRNRLAHSALEPDTELLSKGKFVPAEFYQLARERSNPTLRMTDEVMAVEERRLRVVVRAVSMLLFPLMFHDVDATGSEPFSWVEGLRDLKLQGDDEEGVASAERMVELFDVLGIDSPAA